MDNPYHYPITIRLEPVEGESINGDEMFVARYEHFLELAMAEESPGKAYDGLMALIEKVWAVAGESEAVEKPVTRTEPFDGAAAFRAEVTKPRGSH